jgi:starch synthase (maltosyl-transferring)
MARARKATSPEASAPDGRVRTVIEGVEPEIDAGKFPAKGVAGDRFVVECDAFADGHDQLRCLLLWRPHGERKWREVEMAALPNDRWRGAFVPEETGRYAFTLLAWIDHFGSWLRDLHKRITAGQDVAVDVEIGARLIEERVQAVPAKDRRPLTTAAHWLRAKHDTAALLAHLDAEIKPLMDRTDPRAWASRYPRELEVAVDRERAAFSAWYEFFPRSTGARGKHGTFATAEELLPYVAELGFDIVYLPPVHPIGHTKRKGKNNRVEADADDVGSPWATGPRHARRLPPLPGARGGARPRGRARRRVPVLARPPLGA